MRTRHFLLLFMLTGILLLFVLIKVYSIKTPESELMRAGSLISQARYEKCSEYATIAFEKSENYYDSAMIEWKHQNAKFFLLRKYDKVFELSFKSIETSNIAIENSKNIKADFEQYLRKRLAQIHFKINDFEKKFGNFPLLHEHREELVKCKLLTFESDLTYKNNNYQLCNQQLDSVDLALDKIFDYYTIKLNNYFHDYPQWQRLTEQTISHSRRNNSYAIVIDKIARELLIYKNGNEINSYTIELGLNWIGDKKHQGDKTTPEGLYKVLQKKQKGETKYYKAFLIDYPNAEDKVRFFLNKQNGTIKSDTKIGNLIEIHGNGGKGIDWTDGCIALKDADMDKIFNICPVGTRVVIVGSVNALNKLSIYSK
nr:L,D-transpeptidase family protein [uncultured Carboxylicivirga sp.]